MIQITPHMKILLAIEPADFRKGIDGLAAICRKVLKTDPMSGCLFVFRNKRGTSIKIISYDGQGFWMCQKRLSQGRFIWHPRKTEGVLRQLDVHELTLFLYNADPDKTKAQPPWRKIIPP
jgi:transposase